MDVKKECQMHMKSRDEIMRSLPASVDFGIFHISTDKIRQTLAEKRKAMSVAVLDILSRKCRAQADEICGQFAGMSKRIYEKPNGIEELTDQRQFMKSIPDTIKELQLRINRALSDWSLLADFECNLSDSDFNVRWLMFGWPKKVSQCLCLNVTVAHLFSSLLASWML